MVDFDYSGCFGGIADFIDADTAPGIEPYLMPTVPGIEPHPISTGSIPGAISVVELEYKMHAWIIYIEELILYRLDKKTCTFFPCHPWH